MRYWPAAAILAAVCVSVPVVDRATQSSTENRGTVEMTVEISDRLGAVACGEQAAVELTIEDPAGRVVAEKEVTAADAKLEGRWCSWSTTLDVVAAEYYVVRYSYAGQDREGKVRPAHDRVSVNIEV